MDTLNALTNGTPVASLLLITIAVVSLIGLFAEPALIEKNLLRPYWLVPKNEWPTLVTCGFIHADLGHLFFNGFTFYAFAFALERRIGSTMFFALYLFGLLASSGGTWWKHKAEPDYRSLGASGAILAVLFASIVYNPTQSLIFMFIPVPIPAPIFAVSYLAYTWYASRQARGRINHDAHLIGAAAGLLFVALTDGAAFGRGIQMMLG